MVTLTICLFITLNPQKAECATLSKINLTMATDRIQMKYIFIKDTSSPCHYKIIKDAYLACIGSHSWHSNQNRQGNTLICGMTATAPFEIDLKYYDTKHLSVIVPGHLSFATFNVNGMNYKVDLSEELAFLSMSSPVIINGSNLYSTIGSCAITTFGDEIIVSVDGEKHAYFPYMEEYGKRKFAWRKERNPFIFAEIEETVKIGGAVRTSNKTTVILPKFVIGYTFSEKGRLLLERFLNEKDKSYFDKMKWRPWKKPHYDVDYPSMSFPNYAD